MIHLHEFLLKILANITRFLFDELNLFNPKNFHNYLSDLPFEILANIAKFLTSRDILNLSICCKYLHNLPFAVKFNDPIDIQDIFRLPYYDSFVNVTCNNMNNIDHDTLFPKSLQVLRWYHKYNRLPRFPDTLLDLELGNYDYYPLLNLPNSLTYLSLGNSYAHSLPQLPNSLKCLTLGEFYNQPLPQLPDSLLILQLGNSYNQPLPQLPDSLVVLRLGCKYSQSLPQLPAQLEDLIVADHFDVVPTNLPPNVHVQRYDCPHSVQVRIFAIRTIYDLDGLGPYRYSN